MLLHQSLFLILVSSLHGFIITLFPLKTSEVIINDQDNKHIKETSRIKIIKLMTLKHIINIMNEKNIYMITTITHEITQQDEQTRLFESEHQTEEGTDLLPVNRTIAFDCPIDGVSRDIDDITLIILFFLNIACAYRYNV